MRIRDSVWLLRAGLPFVLLAATVQQVDAQATAITGKVAAVGARGVSVTSEGNNNSVVDIAASQQTQVRVNVLAQAERIRPGTYVEMRVLWNGENSLRATSIKLPEGRPTKFGLYQG